MSKNRYAIVTGASRGIGLAVTNYLAEQGYHLDLLARSAEVLARERQRLCEQYPQLSINIHVQDVGNLLAVQQCVQKIIAEREHIDLLFNNAGLLHQKSICDLNLIEFDEMLRVNLQGAFIIAKFVAEKMKAQRQGCIINLASMAGKRGLAGNGGYCATKYAMVGFSDSLCKEMIPFGVRVSAICPSATNTDMTKHFSLPNDQKIATADIVKTVDYLLKLSPAAIVSSLGIQCAAFM